MREPLSESNFMLYAAKHYDNPCCYDVLEFYEDLNRIRTIKKIFVRFKDSSEMNVGLVVNHIVVMCNTFGVEASTKMLVFKLRDFLDLLKPFLELLGCMPEIVEGIGFNNQTIKSSDIDSNIIIVEALANL